MRHRSVSCNRSERLPVPLRTRRKGRLCQAFVRVRVDAFGHCHSSHLRMKTDAFTLAHGSSCADADPAQQLRWLLGVPGCPGRSLNSPKVIRVPCPVRGMAGLSRRVARSSHHCGWLRAFRESRSPHGVRWPGLPHATIRVHLHVSPRFGRRKSYWNPRV